VAVIIWSRGTPVEPSGGLVVMTKGQMFVACTNLSFLQPTKSIIAVVAVMVSSVFKFIVLFFL
jgi:hypothetical protein